MPLFQDVIVLGGIHIQRMVLIVPVITAILVAALLYLVNHTKMGIAMRASSRDFDTSRLMGINVNRVISITFCIGSLLAAVGAIMWGLKYPKIEPYVGLMPGLKCFIAAVIGGIGNIKGAVVGALMLGVLEILLVWRFSALSGYKDAFAFIILIAILIFKPTGLFGETFVDKV